MAEAPPHRRTLLGRGSFGTVHQGLHDSVTKCMPAVMTVDPPDEKSQEAETSDMGYWNENGARETWFYLRHGADSGLASGIPRFLGHVMTEETMTLSMTNGGVSLHAWVALHDDLATRLKVWWTQLLPQFLTAVAKLHARGIIHADLKPANILIASAPASAKGAGGGGHQWILRLCDFGSVLPDDTLFCQDTLPLSHSFARTTYPFCSPEMILSRGWKMDAWPQWRRDAHHPWVTTKHDMWAIGKVMMFMIDSKHPMHTDLDNEYVMSQLRNGGVTTCLGLPEAMDQTLRSTVDADFHRTYVELTHALLCFDFRLRPSADEARRVVISGTHDEDDDATAVDEDDDTRQPSMHRNWTGCDATVLRWMHDVLHRQGLSHCLTLAVHAFRVFWSTSRTAAIVSVNSRDVRLVATACMMIADALLFVGDVSLREWIKYAKEPVESAQHLVKVANHVLVTVSPHLDVRHTLDHLLRRQGKSVCYDALLCMLIGQTCTSMGTPLLAYTELASAPVSFLKYGISETLLPVLPVSFAAASTLSSFLNSPACVSLCQSYLIRF